MVLEWGVGDLVCSSDKINLKDVARGGIHVGCHGGVKDTSRRSFRFVFESAFGTTHELGTNSSEGSEREEAQESDSLHCADAGVGVGVGVGAGAGNFS